MYHLQYIYENEKTNSHILLIMLIKICLSIQCFLKSLEGKPLGFRDRVESNLQASNHQTTTLHHSIPLNQKSLVTITNYIRFKKTNKKKSQNQ